MTTQLDEHCACQGTVVDFKSGKYTIQYIDGTSAAFTKTALMKVLSPVLIEQTAPALLTSKAPPREIRADIGTDSGRGSGSQLSTLS